LSYSVRQMQEDDIPQVAEIDREAFPTQWPYPAYAYSRELNNRLASYVVIVEDGSLWERSGKIRNGFPLFAPLLGLFRRSARTTGDKPQAAELLAGFAGIWRMLDEAHLTTIAVRETRRRIGIGELLLITMIDMSMEYNASVVTLEVRVSNLTAQSLYRKYGFNDAGLRKGYYSEDGEDALIMTTDVITGEAYQARFKALKEAHAERIASSRCEVRQEAKTVQEPQYSGS
jgi:ribosomal-protein-alanine N-acetyltransferase